MILTPVRRNPLELPISTVRTVRERSIKFDRTHPSEPNAGSTRVSIVIVTFNNIVFNRICIESVLSTAGSRNPEVIVIDNASDDGTREYLRGLLEVCPLVRVIFNDDNLGFAPAVNQGLALAEGEFLVLLNNDTLVTGDWLDRLIAHLIDPETGLVGPVTNRTGNEAQIETAYETYGDLLEFTASRSGRHRGQVFDIPMVAMFCAAMRRNVYEQIGPLDEQFEIGFFEDDDYAMRARKTGYRVVCAEDVFVHHFAQASFGLLAADGRFGDVFHGNRRRWEAKWGREWTPHRRRSKTGYDRLVQEVKSIVGQSVPPGAVVAVVSHGDSRLLEFSGRTGWHFPQNDEGEYAGHYPADAAQAERELDALRLKGAEFLVIPEPSLWWLDYYQEFANYLHSSSDDVETPKGACVIFDLRNTADSLES